MSQEEGLVCAAPQFLHLTSGTNSKIYSRGHSEERGLVSGA